MADSTYSLLIWEEIPDDTKLYLIPNSELPSEYRKHLERANGHFVNIDECPDAEWLSEALGDPEWSKGKSHAGLLSKFLVGSRDEPRKINVPISNVYHSGFML